MPSSRTTSVSEPLAVSIRRHREVSKLSARSNPKASVRIYAHRGSLSKTTKHKMTNLFDKTLLLLVVVSCCGINASTNADDSTKVDAALQAACDTGRPFALRAGNYRVTRLLTCRLANGNGLLVNSLGVTIILDGQTAGIRISGTVGGTDENVFITGLKITAKSPVPFLLDLYGVAEIQLTNLRLDAKKLAPYALMMRAAQKGQISGGSIYGATVAGIRQESATGKYANVRSNAIEIHGVSLSNGSTNIEVAGADDGEIHGNHITGGRYGIVYDMDRSLTGLVAAHDNHFEYNTVAAVWVKNARNVALSHNVMYGPGANDIIVNGTGTHVQIDGNKLNNGLVVGAGVARVIYDNNHQLGRPPQIDPSIETRVCGRNNTNDSGEVVWERQCR